MGCKVLIKVSNLLIKDPDKRIRIASARLMREVFRAAKSQKLVRSFPVPRLVSPIVEALNDLEQDVRLAAADALYSVGADANFIRDRLYLALKDYTKPTYTLPAAVVSVTGYTPKTVKVLVESLSNPDAIVIGTTARALGGAKGYGHQVVPALIKLVEK